MKTTKKFNGFLGNNWVIQKVQEILYLETLEVSMWLCLQNKAREFYKISIPLQDASSSTKISLIQNSCMPKMKTNIF